MTIVIDLTTNEVKSFNSGREAAMFIGIHQSGLAKYIKKQEFYLGQGFFVYKSSYDLDSIYKSETYKLAIDSKIEPGSSYLKDGGIGKYRHTEYSKELIRLANTGDKSKQAKSVILTKVSEDADLSTRKVLEFPTLKVQVNF